MHEMSNDMARMRDRVDDQLEMALDEIKALKSLIQQAIPQVLEVTLPEQE